MYEKTFFILVIFSILFISCITTKPLHYNTTGTERIEELESIEQANETELAITGSKLQCEIEEVTERYFELEQSIGTTKEYEQRINSILCQIEKRTIGYDFYLEWKNRQVEER